MSVIQKVGASALVLVVGGLGYYAFVQSDKDVLQEILPEGANHTVVLSSDGYTPRELTIQKGDVVTFSTTRGFEHWPASDVHPTHNQYAAFDPQRPLAAGETWSFQFAKTGTWAFHDHLNSTFTGDIIVTE